MFGFNQLAGDLFRTASQGLNLGASLGIRDALSSAFGDDEQIGLVYDPVTGTYNLTSGAIPTTEVAEQTAITDRLFATPTSPGSLAVMGGAALAAILVLKKG